MAANVDGFAGVKIGTLRCQLNFGIYRADSKMCLTNVKFMLCRSNVALEENCPIKKLQFK